MSHGPCNLRIYVYLSNQKRLSNFPRQSDGKDLQARNRLCSMFKAVLLLYKSTYRTLYYIYTERILIFVCFTKFAMTTIYTYAEHAKTEEITPQLGEKQSRWLIWISAIDNSRPENSRQTNCRARTHGRCLTSAKRTACLSKFVYTCVYVYKSARSATARRRAREN